MDSSYIGKAFPHVLNTWVGAAPPPMRGVGGVGGSSKFDGGRLESIHGGRAWGLKTAFLKSR